MVIEINSQEIGNILVEHYWDKGFNIKRIQFEATQNRLGSEFTARMTFEMRDRNDSK